MVLGHKEDFQFVEATDPSVKGAGMKKIIGAEEGWTDHVLRIVKLDPQGYSANHRHDWPHINYYIKGRGVLTLDGQEFIVEEGSYTFIPEGAQHQWRNESNELLEFICIVPKRGHK